MAVGKVIKGMEGTKREKEKKENSRIFQIFQIALFDLNNKQIIDCYVRLSFL